MKLLNFFYRVRTHRVAAIVIALLFGVPVISAQQNFQVVSDRSTASLYLGSQSNPTSYNAGIARVSGDAQLNSDDPSASRFNFKIYAAGENSQTASGNTPVISFESKSVAERSDGTLEVRGKLTVAQVERQVITGTGEDYSGQVYGPATLVKTSHESTFVLAAAKVTPTADDNSGNVVLRTVSQDQSQSGMLIIGTTNITGEAFPQLSDSVVNTAWPIPVNDEQCTTPSTVGEDYSGATCTGQVIEPAPAAVVPSQAGEDYAGVVLVPPAGDLVTIQLKLALADAGGSTLGQVSPNSQPQADAQ